MRTYPIVCPSCKGNGWINQPEGIHSSTTRICPACSGSKIVMVTETDDIDYGNTTLKLKGE